MPVFGCGWPCRGPRRALGKATRASRLVLVRTVAQGGSCCAGGSCASAFFRGTAVASCGFRAEVFFGATRPYRPLHRHYNINFGYTHFENAGTLVPSVQVSAWIYINRFGSRSHKPKNAPSKKLTGRNAVPVDNKLLAIYSIKKVLKKSAQCIRAICLEIPRGRKIYCVGKVYLLCILLKLDDVSTGGLNYQFIHD